MSFQTLKLQLNSSTLKQGVLKSMCWLIHVENKSLRLSQKLTFPLLLMRALDFRQISASFSCLLLLWQSKLHKKPVSEVNRSHQSRCYYLKTATLISFFERNWFWHHKRHVWGAPFSCMSTKRQNPQSFRYEMPFLLSTYLCLTSMQKVVTCYWEPCEGYLFLFSHRVLNS